MYIQKSFYGNCFLKFLLSAIRWIHVLYLGLEFKQLSDVPHFMWAIGGDRQVHVHVHGLDLPIRIKEEIYENEVCLKCRWKTGDYNYAYM